MMRIRLRYWVMAVLAGMVISSVVAMIMVSRHYDNNVERFGDPFAQLPQAQRPPKQAGKAMNILVLGSDSRISAGDPTAWKLGAQRTDAIMLMHLPADRASVQLVSIPRDSWVPIPGHGTNKINAAFAVGGPSLMVATVEKLTNVHVDHVMIADFTGFTALTNSLGGVKLGGRDVNGVQALEYVRQRHGLPGGDLDRVRRQQEWMKAVVDKLLQTNPTNPIAVNKRMNSLTKLMAVDTAFSGKVMRNTALSLRKLSSRDIHVATAPVTGSGREGDQAVLYLATDEAEELWRVMRTS